jgi:hypothetical protein
MKKTDSFKKTLKRLLIIVLIGTSAYIAGIIVGQWWVHHHVAKLK